MKESFKLILADFARRAGTLDLSNAEQLDGLAQELADAIPAPELTAEQTPQDPVP